MKMMVFGDHGELGRIKQPWLYLATMEMMVVGDHGELGRTKQPSKLGPFPSNNFFQILVKSDLHHIMLLCI